MPGEPRTVRRRLVKHRDARRRADEAPPPAAPAIPRIARLMACAIVFDEMLARGEVRSYRDIAAIAQVSPARVSQVMALLELAPRIQEAVLSGEDATERHLRPIDTITDWTKQSAEWERRSSAPLATTPRAQ